MLSITALATVANAEVSVLLEPTGTHFEGTTIGAPLYANCDDSGVYSETEGPFFWYASTNWTAETAQADTTTQFGTYTNFWGEYSRDRPEIAGRADTTNRCLLIDTEGGRLFRRIGGTMDSGEGIAKFPKYDVTSTIYFDSLVQFTVNEDEAPTIKTGDKLAVWLKGGETTNLVVTAGWLDNQGGLTPTNYVISTSIASIEPGTWHRLTIEMFKISSAASAQPLGFRVFIDGAVVSSEEGPGDVASYLELAEATMAEGISAYVSAKTLFPSLVDGSGSNANTLSCVAFEGTGAVDDLTFTPNDPFGGVEPPPAEPGYVEDGRTNTCSDATAFVAAFKSGKVLALPEGWVFDAQTGYIGPENGTAFATVPTYYNVAADGTISLNETVVKPVLGTTEGTGDDPDTEPITVGATTVTLNVTNGKAGLYYGVRKYATLGGTSSDSWNTTAQAEDGNVTLTVDKTANATAEFYQVIVTDIAPAAPTAEPAGE